MAKQNGIHWRMPTAMVACYVIGLGLAIGHHFYYYSLDGTRVGGQSKQEWALRIGTGLAFLTRSFLTTAVGIACIQNFWWILQWKPVRLSTLDSMFDIRGSIFNFFDLHLWLRGPNVAVLGLISWLIPLITVITPSTLSVYSTVGGAVSERPMPTVSYDFDLYTTFSEGGPGGPTSSITRLVTSSLVQGSVLQIQAPAPNASYTLDFIAPYVKCNNASEYVNKTVNDYLYHGEKLRVTYVGFTTSNNLTADLDYQFNNPSTPGWYWHDVDATDYAGKFVMATYDGSSRRSVVECAMYNASYTVNFDFVNGEQSVRIVDRKVLNRVLPKIKRADPAPANEDEQYSYTAISDVLNALLTGLCFSWPPRCARTQVLSTSLINSKELYRYVFGDNEEQVALLPSLGEVAASMGENITLSFFSNPYFLQNFTAAKHVNVTVYEHETRYQYSQKNLLIGYGVSVFVSLLCVIAGLLTIWDNGIAFTDSFSTILRATRNHKFDEIVPKDSTTGADPSPQALANTRVLWTPYSGRDDTVAGLKPLPATAECEKAEGRTAQSPISYSNRIPERKTYQQTASRVDISPDGFI